MQKPQVVNATYGIEFLSVTNPRIISFPTGTIALKPNEGMTIEQILNEIGITGYIIIDVQQLLPFYSKGILFEEKLNVFEISRKIYESGKCEYAFPVLSSQVALCM